MRTLVRLFLNEACCFIHVPNDVGVVVCAMSVSKGFEVDVAAAVENEQYQVGAERVFQMVQHQISFQRLGEIRCIVC